MFLWKKRKVQVKIMVDMMAVQKIVREAGGKVLDYEGNDRTMELMGDVVVGNAFIAPILAKDYL